MKPLPVALDCRTCGACCVSNWDTPGYVSIEDGDVDRLEAHFTLRTVQRLLHDENPGMEDPYSLYLATKEDKQGNVVCVGLRGTVGRRVSCRLYEARPEVCRKFEPGSLSCKAARAQAGLDE